VTNATLTPANVTGCVFTFVANGVYLIDLVGLCSSAAATTGYNFCLDTSVVVGGVGLTGFHQLANSGTLTGFSSIADATRTGLSSGVPTLAVNVPILGGGVLYASALGGTAQLQFSPEVAASATCRANFLMRVTRVA
jgi:hypothetical protein